MLVEFGAKDFVEPLVGRGPVSGPMAVDQLQAQYGRDIEFVPYESVRGSDLNSGRPPGIKSFGEFSDILRSYNETKVPVPFNLAWNGGAGLTPDEVVEAATTGLGKKLLDNLAMVGDDNGVQNYITILRDELLEVIKDLYPGLKTVASCIRFTENDPEGVKALYRASFENFDYVVPLPQHTKVAFLRSFHRYAAQMMVFPTLGCARPDLGDCKRHFLSEDSSVHVEWVYEGCQMRAPSSSLISRSHDARGLLKMGVENLKFARRPGQVNHSIAFGLKEMFRFMNKPGFGLRRPLTDLLRSRSTP